MKVKGTRIRCLLEECVKDNYYARFHPHSYPCCKEMKFIPRLDVNFLDSTQIVDGRTDERTDERKVEPLYRTLLKAGAIIKMNMIYDTDSHSNPYTYIVHVSTCFHVLNICTYKTIVYPCLFHYMSLIMRKPVFLFSTRSDTIQPA